MFKLTGILSLAIALGAAQGAVAQALTADIPLPKNPRLEKLISFHRKDIKETGRGVRVCVIDSGQQLEIANRKNLVEDPYNALDDSDDVTDSDGHGTAAAGIIHQIAPNAIIIPVKAFTDGLGNHFAVAAGILHCLENKADVISISANVHSELNFRIPDMIGDEFKNALIVVASGNSNYDLQKEKTETNTVIVTGATNLDLPLQGTVYTVYGSGVDLFAPAGGIDDGIETWTPQSTIRKFNGTSAATPVIAGAMALLKEKHPHLSPARLKVLALKKSCAFKTEKTPTDTSRMLNIEVLLADKKHCQ